MSGNVTALSSFWTNSPAVGAPGANATLINSIDLAIGLVCLLHLLIVWLWYGQAWTTPRLVGLVIACSVVLLFSTSLICDATQCSTVVAVLLSDLLGGGLLAPLCKLCDMFVAYERYRVLRTSEAAVLSQGADTSAVPSVSLPIRIFQLFVGTLALMAGLITWPFFTIVRFFADTNSDSIAALQQFLSTWVEVRSYVCHRSNFLRSS